MNDIGNDLKSARISSSVNLEEASKDTGIPLAALEQIEDGSIGSFKDIFELKGYLETYAKYLGLNSEEIIDNFNEYMFEYTSKIPVDDLEKAIREKEKEEIIKESETNEIRIVSPYLKPVEKDSSLRIIITVSIILILIVLVVIWAIKQVI